MKDKKNQQAQAQQTKKPAAVKPADAKPQAKPASGGGCSDHSCGCS